LQHKLWQKERPGVKLVVWLSTTKSRESTRPRWVQVQCDTPLKSSRGELHVCFRLHPNRRSQRKVMISQASRVQIGTVSGFLLGSPGTKSHSDVGAAEKHRIYYMGEGGGFPWVRVVVGQVNPKLPVACLSIKGAPECELTNLLVGLMEVRVSE
jgi:hypothetical protein